MNNDDLIWLILGASSVAFVFGYFGIDLFCKQEEWTHD